jgi:predicted dinucleotide-binding enzyme
MKIGIIGSGNMGSGLARRIAIAGHDVLMTARNLTEAEKTAKQIGPRVKVVPPTEVAKGSGHPHRSNTGRRAGECT